MKKLFKKFTNRLWNEYNYSLKDHVTLNHEVITEAITSFFRNYVDHISKDEHVMVMFRIKTNNNVTLSIGQLQKINKNDLNYLIEYIEGVLYIKSDEYMEEIITNIIFNFGIRKGEIENSRIDKQNTPARIQLYKSYKLPATMNPRKYGRVFQVILNEENFGNGRLSLVVVTPLTIARIKEIYKDDQWVSNKVEILKNGIKMLSYEDFWIDIHHFKRIINNNTYYFTREGDIDLFTVWKPTRYIKQTKRSKRLSNKIVTLDIETQVVNNQHQPYLISYYDGKKSYSFYLTDYNSVDHMIQACIKSMLIPKYHKHKIYIHNLANFDGIFLLRNLVTFGELNVLLNKGKLISIDLTKQEGDIKIEISFRDSYQILLSSLKKLGKSFDVNTQKGVFPYNFVNNNLDYIGNVPSIIEFDNISELEYKTYSDSYKNHWNLKTEAIKYCIDDCKSLYEILLKFNKMFFDKFHININDHPTLPGLAFRLFRTKYLKDSKIPMIYGDNYKRLKLSYTGGAVDMYIPTNAPDELVYAYDVNSLYPFIMANFPMPVGNITYFEGDIRKMNKDAFGFFYCKIEVPNDIQHPILQTHVNTKAGLRTIAGVGIYHDMLFSHSYDTAIKAGYKIEIL